ncbi:acyl carrier protein [Aquamicrobium zhengzhouense]|uniref:Acyl carrier protein n=1 Tax=Aquamicrobium zhengzhouense TaxID=2781738 RepID=A0ABS0SBP8_9HYPH|nr:acyl carrier protein [Aquamicrobium zhengzhouense]MBI1620065.1 acyl carrier protein [Aquamicrobium zhengzhouense]
MNNTEERLRKVVVNLLDPQCEPARENRFLKDLGADSLDMVELVMATEEEFGIEISDDQWATVKTFGDAVDLVERLLA